MACFLTLIDQAQGSVGLLSTANSIKATLEKNTRRQTEEKNMWFPEAPVVPPQKIGLDRLDPDHINGPTFETEVGLEP